MPIVIIVTLLVVAFSLDVDFSTRYFKGWWVTVIGKYFI